MIRQSGWNAHVWELIHLLLTFQSTASVLGFLQRHHVGHGNVGNSKRSLDAPGNKPKLSDAMKPRRSAAGSAHPCCIRRLLCGLSSEHTGALHRIASLHTRAPEAARNTSTQIWDWCLTCSVFAVHTKLSALTKTKRLHLQKTKISVFSLSCSRLVRIKCAHLWMAWC